MAGQWFAMHMTEDFGWVTASAWPTSSRVYVTTIGRTEGGGVKTTSEVRTSSAITNTKMPAESFGTTTAEVEAAKSTSALVPSSALVETSKSA